MEKETQSTIPKAAALSGNEGKEFVFKVELNNDLRRVTYAVQPPFDTIKSHITKLFDIKGDFVIKYVDPEGDLVTSTPN